MKDFKTTKDYQKFAAMEGNRQVNRVHVERLKRSISDRELFSPIIVNDKMEIIDGQHRFTARKELGLPIDYIIENGLGLRDVQAYNAIAKTWTCGDYMESYISQGIEDYKIFKDFKNKYELGMSETMYLLNGQHMSDGYHKDGMGPLTSFKMGKFKVTRLKWADEFAQNLSKLKGVYSGYKRRSFVTALVNLTTNKDFDLLDFINRVKRQPSMMTDCGTSVQYVALIEEIYNYRRHIKVNLRY